MNLFFDIETQPLPIEEIERFIPEFDESEVKFGNMKDPVKIAAKIESARAKHGDAFMSQAALFSVTGEVCAIGMKQGDEFTMWRQKTDYDSEQGGGLCVASATQSKCVTEKEMLALFWERWDCTVGNNGFIVHFNGHSFDLPFIIQRSWKHGVRFPNDVRVHRYWHRNSIDLRESWQLGVYREQAGLKGISGLDAIARHLGLAGKNGKGADFYKLPLSEKFNYLRRDVELLPPIFNAFYL